MIADSYSINIFATAAFKLPTISSPALNIPEHLASISQSSSQIQRIAASNNFKITIPPFLRQEGTESIFLPL